MKMSHEEADVIIPLQVSFALDAGKRSIVICEDTDIFILLCHFYHEQQWTVELFMTNFSTDIRTVLCIESSVERNKSIIPSLLSVHAFG